jgi:ATP phosphoribosyltransferase
MSDDRQARSNDLALLASEAALLAEKAALESQNQALQEELATAQEAYRFKSREADANGRLAEDAVGAVEALQERADACVTESLEQAKAWVKVTDQLKAEKRELQERAEKAETILETIVVAHAADLPVSHDAALTLARDYLAALSPTQETDPE